MTVEIDGVDIHPGWATGKLVNAAQLAGRVLAALPTDRLTPETTSGREGFVHVHQRSRDRPAARRSALIARDFDDDLLEQHVALVRRHGRGGRRDASRARG